MIYVKIILSALFIIVFFAIVVGVTLFFIMRFSDEVRAKLDNVHQDRNITDRDSFSDGLPTIDRHTNRPAASGDGDVSEGSGNGREYFGNTNNNRRR